METLIAKAKAPQLKPVAPGLLMQTAAGMIAHNMDVNHILAMVLGNIPVPQLARQQDVEVEEQIVLFALVVIPLIVLQIKKIKNALSKVGLIYLQ